MSDLIQTQLALSESIDPGPSYMVPLAVSAPVHARCGAIVAIPARNEQEQICATLAALLVQQDCDGRPLDLDCFEVLLSGRCRPRTRM